MIRWLAESAYRIASTSYHRRWDKRGGWRASVPVISVGNLTVGGNGKTPFVIALVKLLQEQYPKLHEQNRIAILSRGYGRKSKELAVVETDSIWQESGDEPLLIKRNCPSTVVISHAKRVESTQYAIEKFGSKLIILDDGFQHRPLARDIDLVLLDAKEPLGNSHLLPAGTLREPAASLSRATAFISIGQGGTVEPLAVRFGKPLFHAKAVSLPEKWKNSIPLPTFLLTGIARPERVIKLIENEGIKIVGHRSFRDHHEFTPQELLSVEREALKKGAKSLIVTSKDFIRIQPRSGILKILEIPHSLAVEDTQRLISFISDRLGKTLASENS
jgi:tetraacyldisaccharide 4'-kinase